MRPLTSPCSGTAPQDGCRAGCPGRVGWAVCCQCSQTLSGGLLQPPVPHQKGALKPGPLLLAPRCLSPLQHPPAPPTGAAWFSPKPPRAAPAARRSCLLSGTTDSSPAFRPAGVTCADTSTLSPGRTSALSGSPTSCRCPEALRGAEADVLPSSPPLEAESSASAPVPNRISETRVWGEVEQNSSIALPGTGGHSGLLPSETVCPYLGGRVRSFIAMFRSGAAAKMREGAGPPRP